MKRGSTINLLDLVPVLVQKLHQFDLGNMPYRYLSKHEGKRKRHGYSTICIGGKNELRCPSIGIA